MAIDDKTLITGANAAALLGVSPPTFYKMSREDPDLAPVPMVGGFQMWLLSAVLTWIAKRDDAEMARRKKVLDAWEKGGRDGNHSE